MKVLTTLTVSGGLNMASVAKDQFTIGTPLEHNDGNVDDLTVYANADFKNNVILGSSSVDTVTIKAGNTEMTGVLKIPAGSTSTNNISLNGTKGQIYDDGNLHIHGTQNTWINTVDNGGVRLNMETSGDVYAGNNFYMNSGYGSSAKAFGVRAWVNFDGTGATGAKTPRGSGNIASVTKNSTGNYTITFTTAMPDGNYCIQATCRNDAAADSDLAINVHYNTTPSTTSFTIQTARYGSGPVDSSYIMVSVIR